MFPILLQRQWDKTKVYANQVYIQSMFLELSLSVFFCDPLCMSPLLFRISMLVFSNKFCIFRCRFDELQYSRFVGFYMNHTFFFDTNPPLGTMLVALVGWLVGFDAEFAASHIGQSVLILLLYFFRIFIWDTTL